MATDQPFIGLEDEGLILRFPAYGKRHLSELDPQDQVMVLHLNGVIKAIVNPSLRPHSRWKKVVARNKDWARAACYDLDTLHDWVLIASRLDSEILARHFGVEVMTSTWRS